MNRKRVICGIMAAVMLMPAYSTSAAVKSQISSDVSGERRVIGSTSTGASYEELTEKKDLTIDQAVTDAIAFSRDLKNLEDSIDVAEDNEVSVRDNWQNAGVEDAMGNVAVSDDYSTVHSLSVSLREIAIALSTYSANQEIAKQKIEYNIRSLFYNIHNAEKSLVLYDEQIDIKARQLKIYEVMLNLGKLSQVEYNDYKKDYDKTVSDKASIETQITSAYRSLNQLMGKAINQEYNLIVDDITFTNMEEVSLEHEINKALTSNQTVKSAEDTMNLNKYSLDTFVYSASRNSERSTIKTAYEQSTRTYEDTKTNLRVQMSSLYDEIMEAERTYKDNQAELATMEEQLKVKETQYSLGKITELELDAYKLSIDSLKTEMEASAYTHDLSVRKFQNSDLIM
ncbi:MAG: TolC family protein [Clostridia bacterium]|nr:TolC family protein [Clostridia bacterium]